MSRTLTTTTFDARFAGPPFAANGGYVAGVLSERIGARGAHVQLRAPVPLDVPVELRVDDTEATVLHHGRLLASATPVSLLDRTHPQVDFVSASIAAGGTDATTHPFPNCFVCGPDRGRDDGLHLFAGEVAPGLVAVSWRPAAWQADPTGTVPLRYVTAALDCPSAFPFLEPGGTALLATMTFEVMRLPRVGEHLVVTGWGKVREGRKMHAASAIAGPDGETLARANTLWIEVSADDIARLSAEAA